MSWGFDTDLEYQAVLDWADEFITKKVEPLDQVLGSQMEYQDPDFINQMVTVGIHGQPAACTCLVISFHKVDCVEPDLTPSRGLRRGERQGLEILFGFGICGDP